MIVCCPACDQALPIRRVLFHPKMTCPHCQANLEGNWKRWGILQLTGLLLVLQAMYYPPANWQEQLWDMASLLLLMWTLALFVPGQYRVIPPEVGKETE